MNSSVTALLPPCGMEAYIGILWTCKIIKDVFPFISKCPKGSKWQDDHNSLVNMFIWIYLWFAHKVSSTFIECFLIFGLCQLYPIFSWHFWLNWWVFVFFVCSPSLPIPLDGIFPGSKISVHCLKFTPDIFNIIPVDTGKSFRFLPSDSILPMLFVNW